MKITRFLAPLGGALLLGCLPVSFAGVNSWTVTGPEGGPVLSLLMDPDDASARLATTSGGLYRSTNGGLSWDFVVLDVLNQVTNLTRDPTHHNRILAISSRLLLSTDRGLTFTFVQGPPTLSGLSEIAYCADGAVVIADLGGHLWKADAALSSWSEITGPWTPDNVNRIGAVATDPAHAGTIFVGVGNTGLYRSSDGGAHWSGPLAGLPVSPPIESFYALSIDPHDSNRVLVATLQGVYRSTNGGTDWTLASNMSSAWVGWDPLVDDRAILVSLYGTVVRSVDGGASFPLFGADLRLVNVTDVSFDAHHADHFWIASYNGLAQSLDGGDTFTYRNSGIRGGYPYDVVAADDGKIVVAMNAGNGSVFQRGANYTPLGSAAIRAVTTQPFQVQHIAISATNSARIYAVNGCAELVKSTDGGTTWSSPHPAFTGGFNCIMSLAIDPSNPSIAYASRLNAGLWKTIDGGTTWAQLANSPTSAGFMAIDPANDEHMLLVGGTATFDHIYKSTDGGTTWSSQFDGQQQTYLYGIAYDPTNSSIAYAHGARGVWKTTDAGMTWVPFAASRFDQSGVYTLAIDPLLPTTLIAVNNRFAAGFDRTVDGGATWESIPFSRPGTPFPTLYRGILDPLSPNRFVVGVEGLGFGEYDIAPDLEITTVTTGSNPVPLGGTGAFSFTVRNLGPHASSDSTVRIPLPAWTVPSLPSGCARVTGAIECQVGALRFDESRRFNLTITAPPANGAAHIDLTVNGHEPDPISNNSAAHVDLQAEEQADLMVSFPSAPTTADNHAHVTLPIDVKNDGPNASSNTMVTIDLAQPGLAAALTAPSATSSQGTCALAGTTLTCAVGTLANGDTAHISFAADTSAVMNTMVVAHANGDGIDMDTDQLAGHALTIRAVGDLAVTIEDSVDPATTGVPWKYTATVRNNGPDTGTGTVVVALNGATPSAVEAPLGICVLTMTGVTCTLAPLASGASTPLVVTVSSPTAGSAGATATAAFDGTDSAAANNTASATTTKQAPPSATPPGGSGGKSGGGGRFEWLTLLALAAMLAQRRRRAVLRAT